MKYSILLAVASLLAGSEACKCYKDGKALSLLTTFCCNHNGYHMNAAGDDCPYNAFRTQHDILYFAYCCDQPGFKYVDDCKVNGNLPMGEWPSPHPGPWFGNSDPGSSDS